MKIIKTGKILLRRKIVTTVLCVLITISAVFGQTDLVYAATKDDRIRFKTAEAETDTVETVSEDAQTEGLTLESPSCILMEAETGTVLYEKNADEARKPASVTKVMTLLLIFEAIEAGDYSLTDTVTVSEHAASMGGSQCFFEAGEEQTVEDMIKCIVIASGNDAAVAMAEFTSGSEELFVAKMNARAEELGMTQTHFENACGLDADGHETSARDIAVMSRELITKHPQILEYSGIWMDAIIHRTARGASQFDLANTNKFLNMYTGATGLKTGYTQAAKYCMSATAERDGIQLIAVIMGAETKDIRNSEACKLLDYGYAVCSLYKDENVLDMRSVNIENGREDELQIDADTGFTAVLLKGENAENVTKTTALDDTISAPVQAGDVIGHITYSIGERQLGTVDIVAAEDVERLTFGYSLKKVFHTAF